MTEPDPKTKPKKKKSVAKEKTENDELSVPDSSRKSSLAVERTPSEKESKSRKASTAEGQEGVPRSRKSSTIEDNENGKKSRKASSASVKSEKPSTEEISGGDGPAVNEEEQEKVESNAEAKPKVNEERDGNKSAKHFEAPEETSKIDLSILKDLDTRKLAELMEAFNMFDIDQDGVINAEDLKRTFASLDRPDMPEEEIRHMLSEGLNPLDFDAFIVLMGYKTLELDAEEVLMDALAQWDYGTEGLISESRLFRDLTAFGEKFTPEEASAALEDAPVILTKNKERMIDYMRFSNDLCGLRKRMKDYKPHK